MDDCAQVVLTVNNLSAATQVRLIESDKLKEEAAIDMFSLGEQLHLFGVSRRVVYCSNTVDDTFVTSLRRLYAGIGRKRSKLARQTKLVASLRISNHHVLLIDNWPSRHRWQHDPLTEGANYREGTVQRSNNLTIRLTNLLH